MQKNEAQCGYCTTGIIIPVAGLLKRNPLPENKEVIEALNSHLCCCGSHPQVLKAVSTLLNLYLSDV